MSIHQASKRKKSNPSLSFSEFSQKDLKSMENDSSIFHNRVPYDEAMNGQEALDKFKKHNHIQKSKKCMNCKYPCYTVIIMDLNMPIMDGFESAKNILEFLRQEQNVPLPWQQTVKIVALTSYTDKLTYDRCMEVGMIGVYHKPMKMEELKEILGLHHFGLTPEQFQMYLEAEKMQRE